MFVSSLNVLRYLITTLLDNQLSIIRDLQLANPVTNYEEMHSLIKNPSWSLIIALNKNLQHIISAKNFWGTTTYITNDHIDYK